MTFEGEIIATHTGEIVTTYPGEIDKTYAGEINEQKTWKTEKPIERVLLPLHLVRP